MIDLNQIALFVQVVQAGSFAQAARRLGVPPTTLSRQVAQLEDTLQARLLQRTTRKLSLTDAGRTLFDRAVTQIDALADAAASLSGESQTPKGAVRVAATAGFFESFRMEWVQEFLQCYPQVQLEFVLSDGMADFLGEGIDVAFRGSAELPDSSLVARRLASGTLALAASPAYLAERGTPADAWALTQQDCIRASGKAGPTVWRLVGPEGPVQVPVTGRFCANTGMAQRQAAEAGLGICLLPYNLLQASIQTGRLVEVLPGIASSVGNLYVVYPSRRHVPPAVTAFVDMVVERMVPLAAQLGAQVAT